MSQEKGRSQDMNASFDMRSLIGILTPRSALDVHDEDIPYHVSQAERRSLSEAALQACSRKTELRILKSMEQIMKKAEAESSRQSHAKVNDSMGGTEVNEQYIEISNIMSSHSVACSAKKTPSLVGMAGEKTANTEKRTSQWEELMRKFSEAHKEECKSTSVDIPRAPRSVKQFPTGSKYEGTWDLLGMSGYGTYTFPNGVVYTGQFEDGMFEGNGELRYPEGAILRGIWSKGHVVERELLFADGLEYSESDWNYCRLPDRRFTIEYENGLQPGGKSYMTADQPTKEIPEGYYDTGDGFYDPVTKIVYSYDDITCIVRSPCALEQKWIMDNCRKSPDDPLGPRPELYEEWSEPQTNPEPPPPPAAITRSERRSTAFSETFDNDDFYYAIMRKSRSTLGTSQSRRSSIGVKFANKKGHQRFRWQE